MSNFTFIQADFPALYADVQEAESLLHSSPTASAVLARSTLENAINWLYDHDRKLTRPWRSDLNTLIREPCFSEQFNRTLLDELHLVRKIGNNAAHGKRVRSEDALASLKYLFRLLRHLAIYYGKDRPGTQVFDEALIPQPATAASSGEDAKRLRKLQDNLDFKNKKAREAEAEQRALAQHNAELQRALDAERAELAALRAARERDLDLQTAVPLEVSEAETRRRYIDVSLAEAGWTDLRPGHELEYEVRGMPASTNPSGKGFVDYVLWGDDGLPLAVVEAKQALSDARKGKHQASLYADCLEAMHGRRPVIFYSNGFETYLWDDTFAPERQVQGFYSKDALMRLIERRTTRTDPRAFSVNPDIAGRAYQLEAIQRVAENSVSTDASGALRARSRASLLVMATGAGKTRTAAAMVDMFSKCNWVKRVLFLADRNALVTQAKNAFNEHLPHLSAIDLTAEKEDSGTRLVFSTYPTIMNRIDGRIEGDRERFYDVGHFDLIIVDEAHRSVYQKYKAIFDYFDALRIGLTATPREEVDRNTYELFGIEDGDPTFAYELDTAVGAGYLVPPMALSVPLKFVREGIKYHELSDAEKAEYEEKFGDPSSQEAPEEIDNAALNKWLFNTDTVDQVLSYLMQHGLKVQGGDKLGKTIVFAKNHDHAEFIEKRFNRNYPEYAGHFLRVIDNYESKAKALLGDFTDKYSEKNPQIAVSVDMMDTGVDAPRVVNLVFFKLVRSSAKFWQMIGRGTRLCPDLFGPGQDKTHFLIFDYCQNFEYFDANPEGATGSVAAGLTQRSFEAKLELAVLIREKADSTDDERALGEDHINTLHATVAALDRDRFVVKAQQRTVVEYSDRARWQDISPGDRYDINARLAPLVLPDPNDDERARRFDLLILRFQIALLSGAASTIGYRERVRMAAAALLKKQNIPDIAAHVPLLEDLRGEAFWTTANTPNLEPVRLALRDLMKYLEDTKQETVYTHFRDELDSSAVREVDLPGAFGSLHTYKERVEAYVRSHSDHLVIQKLTRNQAITQTDLDTLETILFSDAAAGSREEYAAHYGDKPLGEFIRSIVGLDANTAQSAFAEFIRAGNLNADQMRFINTLIEHLTRNGVIDKALLFEPPFTHIHDQGLLGVFTTEQAGNVIQLIEHINGNAVHLAEAG